MPGRLHIALVCPFDPDPSSSPSARAHVGGVERVYAELARHLAQRGHRVTLLCSSAGEAGTQEEGGIRKVRAKRLTTILRAPVVNLASLLPEDADIVQVPATYPFTTPAVLRRAKAMGIPSVLDFHFEPDPGHSIGRAAARVYAGLGPRAYRLADAVVVRSTSYGRSAPSLRTVPESKWRIIPNGIDPQRFNPGPPPHEQGDHLLFVGRLVPYKGVEVLLKAIARLPAPVPLRIAGDGPLRKPLQEMATRLRLDVQFLGHVADEDLPGLYRAARATVLPSVNRQEAFGITLLESMACGTPVVASDLPGVADLARVGGLVARRGDPGSLATQIHRVTGYDLLPRGRELAQRVHQTYSWDAVTQRFEELYSGLAVPGRRAEVTPLAHPRGRTVL